MQVAQIFKQKKPVVSFEIFPPKRDEALKSIDETLGILTELKPDFISVTFGAGGSVTNSKTVEIASKIKKNFGIEAVGVEAINSGYVIKQYNYWREFIARGKDLVFTYLKVDYAV